jgi:hypothetical protein
VHGSPADGVEDGQVDETVTSSVATSKGSLASPASIDASFGAV